VNEVVCLDPPAEFVAVDQFYAQLPRLQDAEARAWLDQARFRRVRFALTGPK
jgi:predicted phosphoribosyltransferase